MGLIDSKKAIKALTHWETEATDEEIIYTINNLPTVEAIPKDQYEARLKADKMATFKEFRDKLSKWMFHNSESVCGNSMIDIDYLEGYMDELLYELGIYEVENGNDNITSPTKVT